MKKRVFLLAGLMVLALCGCGNKATEPQTPEEFLDAINEEWEREQEATEQAAAEEGYVEGTIPAGNYYKDGDTVHYWVFYTDEIGGFSIKGGGNSGHRGTYEYDPETGIYSLDYNDPGGYHITYEGYFREEDYCFVITSSHNLTTGNINEEESEFMRIME